MFAQVIPCSPVSTLFARRTNSKGVLLSHHRSRRRDYSWNQQYEEVVIDVITEDLPLFLATANVLDFFNGGLASCILVELDPRLIT